MGYWVNLFAEQTLSTVHRAGIGTYEEQIARVTSYRAAFMRPHRQSGQMMGEAAASWRPWVHLDSSRGLHGNWCRGMYQNRGCCHGASAGRKVRRYCPQLESEMCRFNASKPKLLPGCGGKPTSVAV